MKKKIINYIKLCLKFILITVIIIILSFILITYVAIKLNNNDFFISFLSVLVAINTICNFYDNIFPSKNEELETLKEIKKEIEEIKNKK